MPSVSPLAGSSGATGTAMSKAPPMGRQLSQSSQTSRHSARSPGSAGEQQPARHIVKPRQARIVLTRQHGSARNLAKMGTKQGLAHHAPYLGRRHSREESHEGDPAMRLPGSADEPSRTPLRRNWTAYQLPRNTSHTKLKKNLSHGQLTRLGSGKPLAALSSTATRGPHSPGLKSRSRRPHSEDVTASEKDLHEQEIELQQQQQQEKKDAPRKVGFAVGSSGDDEADEGPQMDGSGLQDDEWTDQSASASPYSTRQNTANNSRRASMVFDKSGEKRTPGEGQHANESQTLHHGQSNASEGEGTSADSDANNEDEEPPSPRTTPRQERSNNAPSVEATDQLSDSKAKLRSPLHGAKEHANPATRHLLSRSNQSPAPALVSNVSAMDNAHGDRGSPAASMQSSRSNIGDGAVDQEQHEEEIVSRFLPSSSHPTIGSVGTVTINTPKSGSTIHTPKSGSIHTPENESTLALQKRNKSGASLTPVSPMSTISTPSGLAMQRTRNEMKMMNEKVVAELEDAATGKPTVPAHVYDRRNESLKSYLQLAAIVGENKSGLGGSFSMGPELFQGRFKAVNTELKVVQRFRDPIGESVARLHQCSNSKFAQIRAQRASPRKQAGRVPTSRSTASLPQQLSSLSTSTSPPRTGPSKPAITSAKSATQINRGDGSRRGKVTFAQVLPDTREDEHGDDDRGADAIARQMWDCIGK